MTEKSSRLPGFYKKPLRERISLVAEWADLSEREEQVLLEQGLGNSQADKMVENALRRLWHAPWRGGELPNKRP